MTVLLGERDAVKIGDTGENRVEKSNGSTETVYWYMSPGIVAESDLSGNLKSEYVFSNVISLLPCN